MKSWDEIRMIENDEERIRVANERFRLITIHTLTEHSTCEFCQEEQ